MLYVLGLTTGACLAVIAALGDLRAHLPLFVALFGAAFGAYLAAVWLAIRRPGASRRQVWAILALAVAYRLLLLPAAPTLSDDVYRYVWEGRVLAHGLSPYRYAPDDPALAGLRDDAVWAHVNNLAVPSPYPPLAQLAGLAGAWLTPAGPLGTKVVSTAADLGVIGALLLLLSAAGGHLGGHAGEQWATRRAANLHAAVLVYAWNPLVVVAFGHSGHNDSLMLAPLVLALALVERAERRGAWRRWEPAAAAALIALAALAKVTPLLLLPLLPRRLGLRPAALVGILVAAAWLPFLVLGGGATGSLATYLGQWADNDSLHAVLRLAFGATAAKALSLALLAAGVAAAALHPALRRRPLWWQTYVVLGLSIALASTVHAWYATWLLPLLALRLAAPGHDDTTARDRAPALGWLLFSGLVALTYLTYDTHEWRLWISFAEYAPLFLCLALPALWPSARLWERLRTAGRRRTPLSEPITGDQGTVLPLPWSGGA